MIRLKTANIKTEFSEIYIAADMKSFYASVECAFRGLNPLTAKLLVADETRSDQTICLAVSPALKAIGVPSRPRLFEAKRAIRDYEKRTGKTVNYIIAVPRMREYMRVSAFIYSIMLRYVSPEDIHVYSIDECFIYCSPYLHFYEEDAKKQGVHPAHVMAMTIIRDVLASTGITATVGIGTNLYLAKVCMDIVAKKMPPDKDGVRIAELNEESYCFLLWNHRPLTDFWQIGPGKANRLEKNHIYTMGDIAERSQWDENFFFKEFGIDGELIIDHAWGVEPATMQDIKGYHTKAHSQSNGQVLPRPYTYSEAKVVFREMVDGTCTSLFTKGLVAKSLTWRVSYDYLSLEVCPSYEGPIVLDFYGRLHPEHSTGTIKLHDHTNSVKMIMPVILQQFEQMVDHRLLIRRLEVSANETSYDDGFYQLNLFTDYVALDKEKRIQTAMAEVRGRYGRNAIFKGTNLLKGATSLERNRQVGGHRA